MTRKSIILSIVSVCFLALATYLVFNLNAIIVRTTEDIASKALGVGVSIGDIDVSLSDKQVTVSNIRVKNPNGYKGTYIIETDTISIALNTASADLIDFNDVQVKGSTVNLEINESGMNLIDLKKLANKKKTQNTKGSKQVQVIIKKMVIGSSTIKSRVTFLDKDIATFTVPSISFANLGRGGGVSAGAAITTVITKYLTTIEKQARQKGVLSGVSIPGFNDLEKTIDSAVDSLKSLF